MDSEIATLQKFKNPAILESRLASSIAGLLSRAIQDRGYANLGVSGGRSPVGFFHQLSRQEIPWNKVNVTLADERWVHTGARDSNERVLREHLLQDRAGAANFISLKQDAVLNEAALARIEARLSDAGAFPFDVLTLGLGEDGHTASLFPCAEEIYEAMSPDNPRLVCRIVPRTAPYDRVSFTMPALARSRKIFLILLGSGKLTILDRALAGTNIMEMPIRALFYHSNNNVDPEIFWAPRQGTPD